MSCSDSNKRCAQYEMSCQAKDAQKCCRNAKMLVSSHWHFLSGKCSKKKVREYCYLEGEGVLLSKIKRRSILRIVAGITFVRRQERWAESVQFYLQALSQILAIRKTREFVLLVHIVANYSAASLMLEELLLNLAFLQPGQLCLWSVALLGECVAESGQRHSQALLFVGMRLVWWRGSLVRWCCDLINEHCLQH